GQIEALENHASEAIKALYIPKLISGEWNATMNLAEPQAGSDVGALRTKAEPLGDGTYAITGQKIFITWGDNDFTENVCHLVLARLPDGAEGTRGISLFMVPKILPEGEGLGARNSLKVVSLEHKLGLHGSPTAVMQYDGAKGWLVGEPHKGMAAMFTMMNNARLGVGVQGISVAEAAYQQALAYAMERKQGRTPMGNGAIIDHADVRRMLGQMKAEVFAARSIALACAVAIDMGRATGDAGWQARAAFLTPIAKAYGTDIGNEVAYLGVQVHGGMGFIEETGAAQFARDVRVTAIYEGTNGIQAMDLVGRKMMDGGEAAFRLIDEIEAGAEAARGPLPDLATPLWNAAEALREATEALVAMGANDRNAGAVPYLRAFARVLGGHFHLKAAMADPARADLARFHIRRLLPEHAALLAQMREGAAGIYALTPEALQA
ncbi:MAG: acyl-CoA dehydrogenase, partial [Pseudorhodobacter sp.]